MKIFVTGGAGFIGSHACVELLNAGYEVVMADNFSNSKPETVECIQKITGKPVNFYNVDVRDMDAVRKIFTEHSIAAVIHFAGLKSVPESVQKPLEYYENNMGCMLVLCQAMQEAGCKKIAFSSSATVYGMNNPVPFKEGMPTSATNPYGYTKVMIERILTDLAVADPQWGICLLRYFNPIGAHSSGLIGEDPNGIPNNLLPYVSQVAAGLRPDVMVYGDDYDTPDGTGVRDYIHVTDLALGHLSAVQYVLEHTGVEAVNLGTGHGTSVLEIIAAYSEACGRKIPYRIVPRRQGDIPVCYADTGKAKQLLAWEAQRNITQMCADSWNFARKHYLK